MWRMSTRDDHVLAKSSLKLNPSETGLFPPIYVSGVLPLAQPTSQLNHIHLLTISIS
jgi:hypothetical protein